MKKKVFVVGGLVLVILVGLIGKRFGYSLYLRLKGRKTVEMAYEQLGMTAEKKVKSYFSKVDLSYPPQKLTLIGLKKERVLEVWGHVDEKQELICSYKFTAFSGELGPKLEEGDGQIPEGLYKIDYLNPNSRFHLSMKVSYPNDFDKRKGELDGRTDLGSDIMIHGGSDTIGCIPIGDENIEELFTLVYKTGIKNIDVILAPNDLRSATVKHTDSKLTWLPEKYSRIKVALDKFKVRN